MTLPASGALTLNDIETEFSGTAPSSLKEYYDAAAGIPASGEISIKDFYGASAVISDPWTQTSGAPQSDWTGQTSNAGSDIVHAYSWSTGVWTKISSSSSDEKSRGPWREVSARLTNLSPLQAYRFESFCRLWSSDRGDAYIGMYDPISGGSAKVEGVFNSATEGTRGINYTTAAGQTAATIYYGFKSDAMASGFAVFRDGTVRTV